MDYNEEIYANHLKEIAERIARESEENAEFAQAALRLIVREFGEIASFEKQRQKDAAKEKRQRFLHALREGFLFGCGWMVALSCFKGVTFLVSNLISF